MDSSDPEEEVSFRRNETEAQDMEAEVSSEALTVQMPGRVAAGETPTLTPSDADMRVKEEENLIAIIHFLVDEVKSLKLQVEQQSSSNAGVTYESRSGKLPSETPTEKEQGTISSRKRKNTELILFGTK